MPYNDGRGLPSLSSSLESFRGGREVTSTITGGSPDLRVSRGGAGFWCITWPLLCTRTLVPLREEATHGESASLSAGGQGVGHHWDSGGWGHRLCGWNLDWRRRWYSWCRRGRRRTRCRSSTLGCLVSGSTETSCIPLCWYTMTWLVRMRMRQVVGGCFWWEDDMVGR